MEISQKMIDLVQSGKLEGLQVKILKPKSVKELRKQLSTKELHIIEPINDQIARTALESKQTDILLSPEKHVLKDFMHQRNSGLNHILCKLANKNNIAIGISFSDLLREKMLHKRLGRIMQNIKLCRKYKVKLVLASFAKNEYETRNPKDLITLAATLGMTASQIKEALNFKKKDE